MLSQAAENGPQCGPYKSTMQSKRKSALGPSPGSIAFGSEAQARRELAEVQPSRPSTGERESDRAKLRPGPPENRARENPTLDVTVEECWTLIGQRLPDRSW